MNPARLLAVGGIYAFTAMAWFALGGSLVSRTGEFDEKLAQQVALLWGGRHNQLPPAVAVERPRTITEDVQEKEADGRVTTRKVSREVIERAALPLASSRIDVELHLDPRRKGLLWYDTYAVSFRGRYRLRNPDDAQRTLVVQLAFPSTQALYDDFVFGVNGQEAGPASDLSQGITTRVTLPPSGEAAIEVAYRSRGLGEWTYAFTPSGVTRVQDFRLDMTTDFARIDFPAGTLSPTHKLPRDGGWGLRWEFQSLVTGQKIGMDPPGRLNPGPLAARITFFAPVSLLFFLSVMVILGLLRGQDLHPMNYFFVAAAFFAFHLLLAYLVDHVEVNVAFALASAVSVALVVSYLRLVGGARFALAQAGLAQLVYLVLFSYAFFFEGYTGLTLTLGAILTLFVLMQATGRVDWNQVFARRR